MFKRNRQNTSVVNGRTGGSQVGMLKLHDIQEQPLLSGRFVSDRLRTRTRSYYQEPRVPVFNPYPSGKSTCVKNALLKIFNKKLTRSLKPHD